MKNFFKIFSNNKNNNKENELAYPKHGHRALRTKNSYDDDEPPNPYHAPSQPRRHRPTRSVAGGERLDRYDVETDFHYKERPSRSRHDYTRQSQSRSSKHYRHHNKTSDYGSCEVSPPRYQRPADSDSENDGYNGAFSDPEVAARTIEKLNREIRDMKNQNRQILMERDEAVSKTQQHRKYIRELKSQLKSAETELSMMRQRPPQQPLAHFNHNHSLSHHNHNHHQPSQFARPSYDLAPMNQSLFHPNNNPLMPSSFSAAPPYMQQIRSYSPSAPSTSAAGAGESLANQSSQFVTNRSPMLLDHDGLGDETKVFREVDESSETQETGSFVDSMTQEAEELRSGTPEPLQFTPQKHTSSITLVDEAEQLPINNGFAVPKAQKRSTVSRSLSFNN